MPVEKLKYLQSLEINKNSKQNDFIEIKNKLAKQTKLKWKIPTLIIAALSIMFILVLTTPSSPISTQTASGNIVIESLLITQAEVTPKSGFYPYVQKVNGGEMLRSFNEELNDAQWTYIGPDHTSAMYTVRLKLQTGEVRDFIYYPMEKEEVLYESSSGYAYIVPRDNPTPNNIIYSHLYSMYNDNKLSLYWLIVPFLIFVIAWIDERKMMKETGLNRKPPVDSTYWQSILRILFIVTTVGLLFLSIIHKYQPHLLLFLTPALLFLTIFTMLEKCGENNAWRIRNNIWFTIAPMSMMIITHYGLS